MVFGGLIASQFISRKQVKMGYKPQTADDICLNLAKQLDADFAERNDQAVAQALNTGEPIDAVYSLNETELLSGFLDFLKETGIMAHWQSCRIEQVQRTFLPAIVFVLLYSVRVLFGIVSSNALPALLFSNLAVMSLLGFTVHQVIEGMTLRGRNRRSGKGEYVLMDPATLSETISKTSVQELKKLFNGTIHCLAAFGIFMAEAIVVVDGTQIETTALYQGCGCLKVEKRKRTKKGVKVTIVEFVFGWRLIALMDLTTLMPMAIKVVKIQASEAPYLVELVEQAQENLAPYSRIRWLVVDRAYVDGKSLYKLDQMGIRFAVIAKSTMLARQAALDMKGKVAYYDRTETKRHGQGRALWHEKLHTRLYAVTHIRDWAAYRPPVVPSKPLRREARPTLNAVVVEKWRNHPPSPHGARVYLTNAPVDNPWLIVDCYDDRSWVENGLFRNAKQFQTLTGWFPKKTEAGVRSHLVFVMMVNAITTAYRLWQRKQTAENKSSTLHQVSDHQIDGVAHHLIDIETGEIIELPLPPNPHPTHLSSIFPLQTDASTQTDAQPQTPDIIAHSLLDGQGILRWQRALEQESRDKVVVFIGNQYGIFNLYELLVLVGVSFRHPPPYLDPPEAILRRFGCDVKARGGPVL